MARSSSTPLRRAGRQEVQKLVAKARETSPQLAALYALVLTAGLRLGELCGLRPSDVDWKVNKIRVMRQLLTTGSKPTYGPPKGKRGRIIELDVETIALLKAHKQSQSELKMQNRTRYHDSDLIFSQRSGRTSGSVLSSWDRLWPRTTGASANTANCVKPRESERSSSMRRGTALQPCCSPWVRLSQSCRNVWATRRPA